MHLPDNLSFEVGAGIPEASLRISIKNFGTNVF